MRQGCLVSALAGLATVIGAPATSAQNASGFDGFYVGAHGGYGKLDNAGEEDVEGAVAGFHAGYNYVAGATLFGVEGDYDWSDVAYSDSESFSGFTITSSASLNYYASVRGRLGLVHGSTLVYATAGYHWSEAEDAFAITGLVSQREKFDVDGAVVGFGIEYKFSQWFSARLEGLEYLGEDSEVDNSDIETNVIRAGLSYYLK